ncbi:class III extradiol ring-cleavage dioxygenase family protein [Carnobacterium pleistocenium]|uniref:hypothetical protein n=1 Tax=Carnobacterium pleistocenium TaxID=181073 RepID=UPI0005574BDE|nr:hypothetical protein [Carnobacterium pleistocenium]
MKMTVENVISAFGELSIRKLNDKQLKVLMAVSRDMEHYARDETKNRLDGVYATRIYHNESKEEEAVRRGLEDKINFVPKVNLISIINETEEECKQQNDTFGSFMRSLSEIGRKESEVNNKIATHYAGTNPLD